jgi:dTDP-4-amino-4,6-dideoxygalactose transaminase
MSKVIQLFQPKYDVESCLKSIRSVLESGWTGQGPKCSEFEKKWDEFTGRKCNQSIFVSSATAALHIAVRLLDLKSGDGVATTPLTFVSTNAAIVYEGLRPIFCDCGNDLSLSYESVRYAIEKKKAKAVIWVHYGGNVSSDFYKMMEYAKGKGIPVIEDCAHAAGAFYQNGDRVGSRVDTIAAFSFHSVKNMPIMDGGMLSVPDRGMENRARKLSWLGIDKSTYARTEGSINELYKWSYDVSELGWKYNGNDIAAAIGLVQLDQLDRDNAYRVWLYERYKERLGEGMLVEHENGSSHHLLVACVSDRDKMIGALKVNGVAPGVHYLPNYKFPVFSEYDHSLCKNIEEKSRHIISLPNHLGLSCSDVAEICLMVKSC